MYSIIEKFRNVLRARLQWYGTSSIKRSLWNSEFSRGRWDCLDSTPGDCVYSHIEKYAEKGSILDLGCGSGNTAIELDPAVYEHYTGVDISDVAISMAIKRLKQNGSLTKHRFVESNISVYVPTQLYNVILFRESLYYVPFGKIKVMLNRYSMYLKQDGVFVVRLYNEGKKVRALLDIIQNNYSVIDKYLSEKPKALVIVFRARETLCAERAAKRAP